MEEEDEDEEEEDGEEEDGEEEDGEEEDEEGLQGSALHAGSHLRKKLDRVERNSDRNLSTFFSFVDIAT